MLPLQTTTNHYKPLQTTNYKKQTIIDHRLPPLKKGGRGGFIKTQKQQAQASLQKSTALFNSLLQRAFKGELTA